MSEREKFKRQVASMRAEEDRFGDAVAELSRITAQLGAWVPDPECAQAGQRGWGVIDPDDIEQVRAALRQILAWVDRGKRPTYGDLTAVDWYTLALLPCPDVEEMAGGPLSELSRLTTPRPLSELHEDDGPVLAWRLDEGLEVCEPPYVVSSADLELPWDDDDESRWYWTPLPKVRKPDGAR